MVERPRIKELSEESEDKILCFLHYRYANSEYIIYDIPALTNFIPLPSARIRDFAIQELMRKKYIEHVQGVDVNDEEVVGYSITRLGIDIVELWGDEAYHRVSEGIDFLINEDGVDDQKIPASNRFVDIDHNQPEHEKAVSAFKELREKAEKDNEFGNLIPDKNERQIILSEMDSAILWLSNTKVRVAAFTTIIIPTLKWLADKLADGTIGILATNILEYLVKLGLGG